jgi:plasmid stabilization system protein ParE
MKHYEVIWTNNAEFDLENIIEYIKLDSINIAKNIFFEIKEECQKLYYFPERKRIVPELQQICITKYRELIYKRWRIIFEINEDKVFVLLVVDSSRNIEDILFQRLLKG